MPELTRRQYLAGAAGTIAGSTALLTLPESSRASANVSMGSLSITGDTKALTDTPTSVTLEVTGSWELQGTQPEQSRVVLQVEHLGTSRDMDEVIHLDNPMSGSYTLSADLLAHPEVDATSLLPSVVGETADSTFTVRVILLAVSNGTIQNETFVEDAATLSLTKDGLELSVGGSGSIQVSA